MTPIKLIVGLLSNQADLFSRAKTILENKYGPVDIASPVWDFNHTRYYESELGSGLSRVFYSFKNLHKNNGLEKTKVFCGNLEKKFSLKDKRRINIDPGYITPAKLVLFSTKDYTHRIFIGSGIFAEVTLKYEKGSFLPWPWTYPDYRSKDYTDFFCEVRSCYMKQIKQG